MTSPAQQEHTQYSEPRIAIDLDVFTPNDNRAVTVIQGRG